MLVLQHFTELQDEVSIVAFILLNLKKAVEFQQNRSKKLTLGKLDIADTCMLMNIDIFPTNQ